MAAKPTHIVDIFLTCDSAIEQGKLIRRSSPTDKEFHFQDWFEQRLNECSIRYDKLGRNSYPDFVAVTIAEGYEVKGLAWPGREATYDANSQLPSGMHNGRVIHYVFGRYPSNATESEYPVIDLICCHGDFLNAHHDYIHENKSVRGFGSYGDILIRDRKMYVAPTPFGLTDGTTGQRTLILPEDWPVDDRLEEVGRLVRVEADKLVVGYTFDLTNNTLTPQYTDNPHAGTPHRFVAYRVAGRNGPQVSLRQPCRSVDDSH